MIDAADHIARLAAQARAHEQAARRRLAGATSPAEASAAQRDYAEAVAPLVAEMGRAFTECARP